MNKKEFLKSISKEIEKNKDSKDHIRYCWVKALNTYPQNKEAILDFFHNDFFVENIDEKLIGFVDPHSIIEALNYCDYIYEITFNGDPSETNILEDPVLECLTKFYLNCIFFWDTSYLSELNKFFQDEIQIVMDWDYILKEELNNFEPDKMILTNLVITVFPHLFTLQHSRNTSKITSHNTYVNVVLSRDYFKLISLGVSISSNNLMNKITNGTFNLIHEELWRKNIIYFYNKKKLSQYIKQRFKSDQERNYLIEHFKDITSNDALMVLIMLR